MPAISDSHAEAAQRQCHSSYSSNSRNSSSIAAADMPAISDSRAKIAQRHSNGRNSSSIAVEEVHSKQRKHTLILPNDIVIAGTVVV
jgi:hypothetical protein